MVVLKASMLGVGLLLAASLSVEAAGPSVAVASDQMQLAQTNPEPAYSPSRPPGPKESSDNWIPAPQATAVPRSPRRYPGPKIGPSGWVPASAAVAPTPAGADDRGAHDRGAHPYSQHGTGPMPN
jgi:hypothetical protein